MTPGSSELYKFIQQIFTAGPLCGLYYLVNWQWNNLWEADVKIEKTFFKHLSLSKYNVVIWLKCLKNGFWVSSLSCYTCSRSFLTLF